MSSDYTEEVVVDQWLNLAHSLKQYPSICQESDGRIDNAVVSNQG